MTDVAAGRLSYMFADMAASRTFTQSGKLRVMAQQLEIWSQRVQEVGVKAT